MANVRLSSSQEPAAALPERLQPQAAKTRSQVVEHQVERRGAAPRPLRLTTDPARRHGVGEKEAHRIDGQTGNDPGQRVGQGNEGSGHQDENAQRHAGRLAEVACQAAGERRAEGSAQVGQEDHAQPAGAEPERLIGQAEGDVAVLIDEDEKVDAAQQVGGQQQRMAQMPAQIGQCAAQLEAPRLELARWRQQPPEQGHPCQGHQPHRQKAGTGAPQLADATADQPPTDAAQGVGTDVEPHGRHQRRPVELVAHPGNGHRRQPTEHEALNQAQRQQGLEVGREGQAQRTEPGQQQRHPHDATAANGIGQGAEHQQCPRQGQGGNRHDQTHGQGRDAIGLAQVRQQRLRRIEIDEHQNGAETERQSGPPPSGGTRRYHAGFLSGEAWRS